MAGPTSVLLFIIRNSTIVEHAASSDRGGRHRLSESKKRDGYERKESGDSGEHGFISLYTQEDGGGNCPQHPKKDLCASIRHRPRNDGVVEEVDRLSWLFVIG